MICSNAWFLTNHTGKKCKDLRILFGVRQLDELDGFEIVLSLGGKIIQRSRINSSLSIQAVCYPNVMFLWDFRLKVKYLAVFVIALNVSRKMRQIELGELTIEELWLNYRGVYFVLVQPFLCHKTTLLVWCFSQCRTNTHQDLVESWVQTVFKSCFRIWNPRVKTERMQCHEKHVLWSCS